jgi:hypothetical protein
MEVAQTAGMSRFQVLQERSRDAAVHLRRHHEGGGDMTVEKGTVRLLGVAFLVVFVASTLSGALPNAATGQDLARYRGA